MLLQKSEGANGRDESLRFKLAGFGAPSVGGVWAPYDTSYDDLIDNNIRRIQILDEMVQMIYREWFVHFRFPGYRKVRMVDSSLGKIPDGWCVGTLESIVSLQRGFDITKAQQNPGSYPVISSSGPTSTHDESKVKGPGIVLGRKGTLGTVFHSQTSFWPHDTTLWVTDFHGYDIWFAYYLLRSMNLGKYDCGASNPTLNRNHLHKLQVLLPLRATTDKFGATVENMKSLTRILEAKNAALRQTREILLPKLITGEIDVSDLDIATGEVAA